MEDRHTVINSFQPRTSTGQTVQVRLGSPGAAGLCAAGWAGCPADVRAQLPALNVQARMCCCWPAAPSVPCLTCQLAFSAPVPTGSGGYLRTLQDGVFRAYAAVFDGHNGASAAEHAADRLHHVLAVESAIRTCTGGQCSCLCGACGWLLLARPNIPCWGTCWQWRADTHRLR